MKNHEFLRILKMNFKVVKICDFCFIFHCLECIHLQQITANYLCICVSIKHVKLLFLLYL